MSNLELDNLPIEMLEEIFSYALNKGSLLSCRLVNRRWNSVATNYWRQLPSTQAQVSTPKSMTKFLSVMNSRIQDFPFNRIRFNILNLKRIEPARTLLMEISTFIEDLHIGTIKGQTGRNRKLFQSFIEQFDISLMPNLVKIRIEKSFKTLTPPTTLCLEKLHTLHMPISTAVMKKLSSFLVKSAPNLKVFKTSLEYKQNYKSDRIPAWELGEEYRHITLIQIKLKLDINFTDLRMYTSLIQKFDDWKSIQVTELKLDIGIEGDDEAFQGKKRVESLIQRFANSIQDLEIRMIAVDIKLPVMCNLETLKLTFAQFCGDSNTRIEPIEDNQFPRLRNVRLYSYREPYEAFRTAVLESVKTFVVVNPYCKTDDPNFRTRWDKAFPNLEEFTYVNHYFDDWYNERPFFEHIFSCLRMKSLRQVSLYALRFLFDYEIPGVQNILSGFTELKEVLAGAVVARDTGGKIEEDAYWTRMETLRNPCMTNMPGLTTLHLDFAMDDDVISGVIARMKPLNKLTIDSKYLSQETIQTLKERHEKVVLLYNKAKKQKRTRRPKAVPS